MQFSVIEKDKEVYMPLLLEADPSPAMVRGYLETGTLLALEEKGKIVCVAAVTETAPDTIELRNLATAASERQHGFATAMLSHINERYAPRYVYLTVGAAATRVAFFKKQGFMITHTVPDYFTAHYPEPVMDRGVLCVEKIYLRKVLRTHGLVRVAPTVLQGD